MLATAPGADATSAPVFCYAGAAGGIEETLATRAGLPFRAIETGQIRGQAPWTIVRNLARMGRGLRQCMRLVAEFKPDVVFMTGGYVATPAALAAWRSRPAVPLLIYLPDLTPGQTIRLTSRIAARVAVSFPEVARYFGAKAVVTGYPVRPEIGHIERRAARAALELDPAWPTLLVFGGSRGAHSINQAVIAALPTLLPHCQIVHVSGEADAAWSQQASAASLANVTREAAHRYRLRPYLHEMAASLAAADLVVARAGAATLGEFPAAGVPSILIPYPYAGQHQDANASYLAQRGAAVVIADRDLAAQFAPTALRLLTTPAERQLMAERAAALAQPDAAAAIAQELHQLAGYQRWKH